MCVKLHTCGTIHNVIDKYHPELVKLRKQPSRVYTRRIRPRVLLKRMVFSEDGGTEESEIEACRRCID